MLRLARPGGAPRCPTAENCHGLSRTQCHGHGLCSDSLRRQSRHGDSLTVTLRASRPVTVTGASLRGSVNLGGLRDRRRRGRRRGDSGCRNALTRTRMMPTADSRRPRRRVVEFQPRRRPPRQGGCGSGRGPLLGTPAARRPPARGTRIRLRPRCSRGTSQSALPAALRRIINPVPGLSDPSAAADSRCRGRGGRGAAGRASRGRNGHCHSG